MLQTALYMSPPSFPVRYIEQDSALQWLSHLLSGGFIFHHRQAF